MDENSYGIKKIGPQRYREDPGRYFEDFQVGDVYEHWPGRTVSEADNIWFTNLTMNTHPIHFDANYASKSEFGKYLVNSAFTLALVTGMCVSGTSQKAIANLGWEEIRLPNPVFEGDTIYSESKVLEKRESKSRKNVGIILVKTSGYNQDGIVVITFKRRVMVYKKGMSPLSSRPEIKK